MGSQFCGEVQYQVQDPDHKEQLRTEPVSKLEQQQHPVQETESEEPLGPESGTKWINITIKW